MARVDKGLSGWWDYVSADSVPLELFVNSYVNILLSRLSSVVHFCLVLSSLYDCIQNIWYIFIRNPS